MDITIFWYKWLKIDRFRVWTEESFSDLFIDFLSWMWQMVLKFVPERLISLFFETNRSCRNMCAQCSVFSQHTVIHNFNIYHNRFVSRHWRQFHCLQFHPFSWQMRVNFPGNQNQSLLIPWIINMYIYLYMEIVHAFSFIELRNGIWHENYCWIEKIVRNLPICIKSSGNCQFVKRCASRMNDFIVNCVSFAQHSHLVMIYDGMSCPTQAITFTSWSWAVK